MVIDYFKQIIFTQPYFFLLIFLLPIVLYKYKKIKSSLHSAIPLSTISINNLQSWRSSLANVGMACRVLAILSIIMALANPQVKNDVQKIEGDGIEIVLCLDVSGSMMAQDLKPNRLEAAKAVAISFVKNRPNDKLGMVIFAGESFTQCPLTLDHTVLVNAIQNVHSGLLVDGTAIGDGLATSVDRIRQSKAKSKIILLLTDGENNSGLIDPNTAKEIAKAFGIKVYTIGVGTEGETTLPMQTELGIEIKKVKVSIDEKLLTQIANETGGQYYRAKDNDALKDIYATIDGLEKSKIQTITSVKYVDKYLPFAIAAAFFLLVELLLRYLILKKFP